MSTENVIRAVAGTVILPSLVQAYTLSPYWYLMTAFVGVNLLRSSFTGFCPLEAILKRTGIRQSAA